MKLIVGLGNPGKQYMHTRHNVGFRVLDGLARACGGRWGFTQKFNADLAKIKDGNQKIILCKPQTYMNSSGQPVQLLANYYKIAPSDIFVVYDDKDLRLGLMRFRTKGSSAGHNGAQSIIDHLITQEFNRVRVGVAGETTIRDTAEFVLNHFTTVEEKTLQKVIKNAVEFLLHAMTRPVPAHQDITVK